MLKISFLLFFYLICLKGKCIQAQLKPQATIDSVSYCNDKHPVRYPKLIVPIGLITAGATSFAIPALKELDRSTMTEVLHVQAKRTTWDNYTQYFPAVMVYGLNAAGIKGKHDFKDRTFIYASSQLIATAIVTPSKNWIGEMRPDGSNYKSFPSGHAATAFSTAHFMFREYHDRNLLWSLSGYPFAIFTGVYRVINNKHWVTDVVAGAGVGILSTELAYLAYPVASSLFRKKNKPSNAVLMPYYQSKAIGLSYMTQF